MFLKKNGRKIARIIFRYHEKKVVFLQEKKLYLLKVNVKHEPDFVFSEPSYLFATVPLYFVEGFHFISIK